MSKAKFKVGDKVRCVDVQGPSGKLLKLDVSYVVTAVDETGGHAALVYVNRVNQPFFETRFSLVSEPVEPTEPGKPDPLKDPFTDADGQTWIPDPNGDHYRWTSWVAHIVAPWAGGLSHGEQAPSFLGVVGATCVRYSKKAETSAAQEPSEPFPDSEEFLPDGFIFYAAGAHWEIHDEGDHGIWTAWPHPHASELSTSARKPLSVPQIRAASLLSRHRAVYDTAVYYRCRRLDPRSIAAVPPRIVETVKWGPVEVERGNGGLVTYIYSDGVERVRLPVSILFEWDPKLDPFDPNVVARVIADHESLLDTYGKECAEDTIRTINRIREAQRQEREAKKLPGPGTACEWGEP